MAEREIREAEKVTRETDPTFPKQTTPSPWHSELHAEQDKRRNADISCEPPAWSKAIDALRSPFYVPGSAGGDTSISMKDSYRLSQRERVQECEREQKSKN